MKGNRAKPAPPTIVSMSLRLAIPRQVALQHCPLPLRQPMTIVMKKGLFEKEKPLNGKCANCTLSQQRGSPRFTVPKLCPNRICWSLLGCLLSEKQIPQIAVNIWNRRKIMEPLEQTQAPWAQGVESRRPDQSKWPFKRTRCRFPQLTWHFKMSVT